MVFHVLAQQRNDSLLIPLYFCSTDHISHRQGENPLPSVMHNLEDGALRRNNILNNPKPNPDINSLFHMLFFLRWAWVNILYQTRHCQIILDCNIPMLFFFFLLQKNNRLTSKRKKKREKSHFIVIYECFEMTIITLSFCSCQFLSR